MKVLKFLVTIIVGVNKRAKLVLRRPDHVGTKQEWKKKNPYSPTRTLLEGRISRYRSKARDIVMHK